MSAINTIAAFVANAPRVHEEEALARSQRSLIDTLACMYAGADQPVARSARSACQGWGSGTATVTGSELRMPPPFAALVNGAAAHALDYDDYDLPTNAHPSAVIFPALLALADAACHSGHDLLDAHVVGVEVMQRLGEALNMDHYRRGWHTTVTLGGIGAAAACSRLVKAAPDTASNALSLAASMSSGLNNQIGFPAKQLHAGLAAKNGLMAAQLAAAGVSGSDQALDGPVSIATVMTGIDKLRIADSLGRLGKPWSILEHGLIIKPYPSCGYTHRIIDAARELHDAGGVEAQAIDSIEISVPDFYLDLLIYAVPEDSSQAMFSAPYTVAAALQDGHFNLASLASDQIRRPDVRALCRRSRVAARKPSDPDLPFSAADPDSVSIHLQNGQCLRAAAALPSGVPDKPLDDAAFTAKFVECAGALVDAGRALELFSLLQTTVELNSVEMLQQVVATPGLPVGV